MAVGDNNYGRRSGVSTWSGITQVSAGVSAHCRFEGKWHSGCGWMECAMPMQCERMDRHFTGGGSVQVHGRIEGGRYGCNCRDNGSGQMQCGFLDRYCTGVSREFEPLA